LFNYEYGFYPLPPWEAIKERDWELIEGITRAESFDEAAKLLHLSVGDLGQKIGALLDSGVYPPKGQAFTDLKRYSQQLIQRYHLIRRLDRIENRLKRKI